ncbi:MAG: hypothetical protein NUW07_02825 [Candidatus Saccharicenans sp.]|jgi:hypothetical protein|nr:hypothetical protein [Candidatus Saccharicenans sp.]MDH7493808.1 hypothetical protein [Candidatus Saccharicenans sp.]
MKEKKLLSFLRQAREILSDFFPAGSVALLPLLLASLTWAVNRRSEIKSRLLGLKVWLEPETLQNKPAEFILDFFAASPELKTAFASEINSQNLKALRPAFRALYPILGLQDPFLERLFSEELRNHDYRQVVAEFRPRLQQALEEIEAARVRNNFWRTLENLTEGFLSLGWRLLAEDDIREQLKKIIDRV